MYEKNNGFIEKSHILFDSARNFTDIYFDDIIELYGILMNTEMCNDINQYSVAELIDCVACVLYDLEDSET